MYVQLNHSRVLVVVSFGLMLNRILTYYETNVESTLLFALAFIYDTSIRLYLLCEL